MILKFCSVNVSFFLEKTSTPSPSTYTLTHYVALAPLEIFVDQAGLEFPEIYQFLPSTKCWMFAHGLSFCSFPSIIKTIFLYHFSSLILSLVLDLCSLQYYLYFIILIYWGMGIYRSEDNLQELVFFFYHLGPQIKLRPWDLEESTFICWVTLLLLSASLIILLCGFYIILVFNFQKILCVFVGTQVYRVPSEARNGQGGKVG